MPAGQELTVQDRFEIFEQLNKHQRAIDTGPGKSAVDNYNTLYWPEAKFHVFDLREATFAGPEGRKQMYDYAHSVFPIEKWFHAMGPFEIAGAGDQARVEWRWIVSWREGHIGTVSTGTYSDRFERRNGVWKCIERTSRIDPNWPADLFQPYIDLADRRFKAS
jgi:hypothetical protein